VKKRIIVGLLIFCLVSVAAIPASMAIGLGDVLKVGGVGFLVSKFATPLNNFINTLTFKHGAGSDYATKVVPIISLGSGGYIGAAQVTGAQDLVNRTQAVLQIEADFNSQFRVKAVIPIDSINPLSFSRVQGVGVSAIIDVRI
jgi:hypothetical protein